MIIGGSGVVKAVPFVLANISVPILGCIGRCFIDDNSYCYSVGRGNWCDNNCSASSGTILNVISTFNSQLEDH